MEKFPESFKPEHFIEMRKLAQETRRIKVETDVKSSLPTNFEPNKTYTVRCNGYTEDEINEAIKLIKKIPNTTGHILRIMCCARHTDNDGRYIRNPDKIEYTFLTKEEDNRRSIDHKNHIRKIIVDSIHQSKEQIDGSKDYYEIKLKNAYRTDCIYDIIGELKELGWIWQMKDHWKHIEDDYSVMDINLILEM